MVRHPGGGAAGAVCWCCWCSVPPRSRLRALGTCKFGADLGRPQARSGGEDGRGKAWYRDDRTRCRAIRKKVLKNSAFQSALGCVSLRLYAARTWCEGVWLCDKWARRHGKATCPKAIGIKQRANLFATLYLARCLDCAFAQWNGLQVQAASTRRTEYAATRHAGYSISKRKPPVGTKSNCQMLRRL